MASDIYPFRLFQLVRRNDGQEGTVCGLRLEPDGTKSLQFRYTSRFLPLLQHGKTVEVWCSCSRFTEIDNDK